jgi:hypothetical protein
MYWLVIVSFIVVKCAGKNEWMKIFNFMTKESIIIQLIKTSFSKNLNKKFELLLLSIVFYSSAHIETSCQM